MPQGDEEMSLRTLRGYILGNSLKEAFVYQANNLERGWRVLSVQVCDTTAPVSGTTDGIVLHTDNRAHTSFNFWDNRVIGIAARTSGADNGLEMIDPNHIVTTGLYISNLDSAPATYLIILEEIKVGSTENIIYQLKERAQGAQDIWRLRRGGVFSGCVSIFDMWSPWVSASGIHTSLLILLLRDGFQSIKDALDMLLRPRDAVFV
jgi:hypothetical protein